MSTVDNPPEKINPKVGHAFSLSVPVAFDTPTAIRDLCAITGNPDAAIYALRLWDHRQRQAASFCVNDPAGVVERICGWRRKRGDLFGALDSCGLIRVSPDNTVTIPEWREIATVEWMGAAGVKRSKRTDANAAERARAWRANAKRTQTERTANASELTANADRTQTERTPDRVVSSTYARDTRATGTETSPAAVAGVTEAQNPAPTVVAAPVQVALLPDEKPTEVPTEKNKTARKSKEASADPTRREDADAWVAAYHAAVPEADRVPLSKAFWVQWSARRKDVGIEAMLRSLRGILSLPLTQFPRNADPIVWVTQGYANGVNATSAALAAPRPVSGPLRAASAPVAPTPPRPEYWKPPPPPPFDPHAELAGVEAKRSITGTHAQIIWLPEGAEWPADLAIPDGVTLKRREARS